MTEKRHISVMDLWNRTVPMQFKWLNPEISATLDADSIPAKWLDVHEYLTVLDGVQFLTDYPYDPRLN